MAAIGITGTGLTGVVRMTWVQDDLAHVLDHARTDETPGTWTGRACPRYGLALGGDVDAATLRRLARPSEIADLTWEAPDDPAAQHARVFQAAIAAYQAAEPEHAEQLWEKVRALWSQAWSANYAALEFLQDTGLSRFSPVKPQRWLAASFEHHTSPHGPISLLLGDLPGIEQVELDCAGDVGDAGLAGLRAGKSPAFLVLRGLARSGRSRT